MLFIHFDQLFSIYMLHLGWYEYTNALLTALTICSLTHISALRFTKAAT